MTYRSNVAQKRVSKMWSTMAPVKGINDQEPLAATPPEFCIELKNWFPGNNALESRRGFKTWADALSGPVESILTYYDMSGTAKIFATTATALYDVTLSTPSAIPDTDVVITNGDYKGVMFGTVANQYLVAVNGHGSPALIYDGTSWAEMTMVTPSPLLGEIEGVDPKTFIQVTTFKRRLWFVEADSMTAWYLPTDSLAGVAKPFYLTSIFRRGGKLRYIIDWSVDAGDGLNDKLVFVSDLGEIAVYSGDDPDDATTWALEAVFYSSAPMGDRTYADVGGDVMFLTTFGVIQLSAILSGEAQITPAEASLSKNVNRTLNGIATSKKYLVNWQIYNLPNSQALMVNIPPNGDYPAIQFVMNTLTGAWTEYDLPINCAANLGGNLYFGTTDGRVCIFGEDIYLDNVGIDSTGGEAILCDIFTAYSYMDNPGALKHWKLLRPLFQATFPPNYVFKLNTDFSLDPLIENPAPPTAESLNPALWDEALWDQAKWVQRDSVYRPWLGIGGIGFACALLMKTTITDRTRLVALEYIYEEGGII